VTYPVTVGGFEFPVTYLPVRTEPGDADDSQIQRIRKGDMAALGSVYDSHHEHVRAFCQRFLGDEQAAEDLVQDVFLALPDALSSFRGEALLRTFLISIAVNRAKNHLRGAIRKRAFHARLSTQPGAGTEDPERVAQRRQLADALTQALDALPQDQRVALVLCEVEERSSAEAAAIVGVPEGTIRSRIFHGKRKLREALAPEAVR
jgi:RNA polymerase sigma-70 factor, ECF subfamily